MLLPEAATFRNPRIGKDGLGGTESRRKGEPNGGVPTVCDAQHEHVPPTLGAPEGRAASAASKDPREPSSPLFPEEAQLVASAVEKRRLEFSRGRQCALPRSPAAGAGDRRTALHSFSPQAALLVRSAPSRAAGRRAQRLPNDRALPPSGTLGVRAFHRFEVRTRDLQSVEATMTFGPQLRPRVASRCHEVMLGRPRAFKTRPRAQPPCGARVNVLDQCPP